jgi:2-aminoethylphosphonate transport system permease protein
MVLRRIVLPQMAPAIRSSLAIAFAISIGELGATMTVYPPGFATAPVLILGEVERGYYLPASALSVLLLGCALLVLIGIALPWGRALAWSRTGRPSPAAKLASR